MILDHRKLPLPIHKPSVITNLGSVQGRLTHMVCNEYTFSWVPMHEFMPTSIPHPCTAHKVFSKRIDNLVFINEIPAYKTQRPKMVAQKGWSEPQRRSESPWRHVTLADM